MNRHKILFFTILSAFILVQGPLEGTANRDHSFVTTLVQDPQAQKANKAMKAVTWRSVEALEGIEADERGKGPVSKDMELIEERRIPRTDHVGGKFKGDPQEPAHFVYNAGTKCRATSAFGIPCALFQEITSSLHRIQRANPDDESIRQAVNAWGTQNGWKRVRINPHDKTGVDNAYYSRDWDGSRVLNFFPMSDEDGVVRKRHTGYSSDIIAHEAGHAILDALWEELFSNSTVQAGGIHEAFGDWMSIFWALRSQSLAQAVYQETQGDLTQSNLLTKVAEEFGFTFGDQALRDVEEDLHIRNAPQQVHAISLVQSGAWWDVFSGLFGKVRAVSNGQNTGGHDFTIEEHNRLDTFRGKPAEILPALNTWFLDLLVESIVRADKRKGTFMEIGRSMHAVAQKYSPNTLGGFFMKTYAPQLIKAEFERRGIWEGAHVSMAPLEVKMPGQSEGNLDRAFGCHTLHAHVVNKKRAEAQAQWQAIQGAPQMAEDYASDSDDEE